jgi:hypothetical protein
MTNAFKDLVANNRVYVISFLIVLGFNALAKSGALNDGFAIDDYALLAGADMTQTMLSQGRIIQYLWYNLIHQSGVNLMAVAPFFAILSIFLQSLSSICILRFLEVRSLAGLIPSGLLITLHPYTAEIFTYRMSLPAFSLIMALLSVILVVLDKRPSIAEIAVTVALCAIGIMTYQVIASYIAMTAGLSFIACLGARAANTSRPAKLSFFAIQKPLLLSAILSTGIVLALLTSRVVNRFSHITPDTRSTFLSFSCLNERIMHSTETLYRIFFQQETIFPQTSKILLILVLTVSAVPLLLPVGQKMTFPKRVMHSLVVTIFLFSLAPLSLGVMLAVNIWWPNYRILAHSSLLFALVGMGFFNPRLAGLRTKTATIGINAACLLLVLQFLLESLGIFHDQRMMNNWDKNAAQQMVNRMQAIEGNNSVKVVHVDGGSWRYPLQLPSTFMDLNISAWAAPWARVPLLNFSTGSAYRLAEGDEASYGARYCKINSSWPAKSSIAVFGHLGIICLGRT